MKHISLIFVSHIETHSRGGFNSTQLDPQHVIRLNNITVIRSAYINMQLPISVSIKQNKLKVMDPPTIRI